MVSRAEIQRRKRKKAKEDMTMTTKDHVCHEKPTTNEKMKRILTGSIVKEGGYTCAGCSKSFPTICVLHFHCMKHSEGGSFYFDHVTKTAYPKHDTTCSYTQVDMDLLSGDLNDETLLADNIQFLSATAREINQNPLYKRKQATMSVTGDVDNTQKVSSVNSFPMKIGKRTESIINVTSENTDNSSDKVEDKSTQADEDEESVENYLMNTSKMTRKRRLSFQKGDSMSCKPATPKKNRVSGKESSVNKEAVKTQVKRPNKGTGKGDQGCIVSNTDSISKKDLDKVTSPSGNSAQDTSVCNSPIVGEENAVEERKYSRYPRCFQSGKFLKRKHLEEFQRKVPYCRPPKQPDEETQVKKVLLRQKSCRIRKVTSRFSDAEWETPKEKSLNSQTRHQEKVVVSAEDERGDAECHNVQPKISPKDKSSNSWRDHSAKVLVVAKDERGDTKDFRVQPQKEEQLIKHMYQSEVSKNAKGQAKQGKGVKGKSKKGQHGQKQSSLKSIDLENSLVADEVYPVQENGGVIKSSKNQPKQEKGNIEAEAPAVYVERDDLPTDICKKEIDEVDAPVEENLEIKIENEDGESITDTTSQADLSAGETLLSLSDSGIDHSKTVTAKSEYIDSDENSDNNFKTATTTKNTKEKNDAIHVGDNDPNGRKCLTKKKRKMPKDSETLQKCETCGKVGIASMIKYHEELHSSINYICEVCGKEYKTRKSLKSHLLLHGERMYKCYQCPRTFYRRQYWVNHLKIHNEEFPFVCPTCNKGFRESYILKRHIKHIHDNVRNFECDICNEKFFTSKILAVHRLRHFNPTVRCHYCPKMFKTVSDRLRHELTHSGEKLYFCPKCSTGFSQLHAYYRHMKNKHEIGREEARKIKIKNDSAFLRENIHLKLTEYNPDNVVDGEAKNDEQDVVNSDTNEQEASVSRKSNEQVDTIRQNKNTVGMESLFAFIKDGKLILKANEGLVPECNEEVVIQSDEEMVIQSSAHVGNELFDHLYVADPSNVKIQVLNEEQQLEEGSVVMETTQENPGTGNVSVVQQNIVVLSEYPEIEGIEGYTQEYSTLNI